MVDWWSLGTFLYEILVGIPPFYHHKQHRMFKMIKTYSIPFPVKSTHGFSISDQAKDLISKLLMKDPNERIGRSGGVNEILAHPWFAGLDQDQVLHKKVKSPYIPEVKENLYYFDPLLVNVEEPQTSIVPQERQELIKKNQSQF